ncbi:DUF547 domain-containing protein [Aquimarina rhabdastrellae]
MKVLRLMLIILMSGGTFSGIKAQSKVDHMSWDQVLILNVSKDGKVNYKGVIQDSPLLYKYFSMMSENPPEENWSDEEKLAYWVNLYNAIAIKMVIDNYPIDTIKDLQDPWNHRFFKIGDKKYSLDDIEHKILREMNDPRIHFIINCAAKSCPDLWNRAYTAENINKALDERTRAFINDPRFNVISGTELKVSRIFDWYKKDFEGKGSIEDFINRYSEVQVSKIAKDNFKEYDWTLNN